VNPKERIRVVQGDITKLEVDAIVNAANSSLMGGGGVDGAIHKAAGPELLAECMTLNGCPTGEAVITGGYKLPAKHVIHTVGPVWKGGNHNEDALLASAWRNSLRLAAQNNIETIAFPSISTGVYGFPVERAANIAVREVVHFLAKSDTPQEVLLVCFSDRACEAYSTALEGVGRRASDG
jgi:O-acetyl-ADP-ribose deacetylase (regulator of RNase III)